MGFKEYKKRVIKRIIKASGFVFPICLLMLLIGGLVVNWTFGISISSAVFLAFLLIMIIDEINVGGN